MQIAAAHLNTNTIQLQHIPYNHSTINEYSNVEPQQQQQPQNLADLSQRPNIPLSSSNISIYLKLFFSYLYLTQGLVISFSSTMPYIYPQLPTYSTMSIFTASLLPYSFKFILAPFLQKYSYLKYGKRKLWIIISQVLSSGFVLIASFYTKLEQADLMAGLLFAANFCFTLQDISLDSLARKQLKIPHLISNISTTTQLTGTIIGSMILLKFSSLQFAQSINLTQPISTPSTIIKFLSFSIFIPSIFIHVYFKETLLQSQLLSQQLSIWKVISSYRAFFKIQGKYFRTCLYLIISTQGFNFFNAGYEYELIQSGFSRNILNTIQNIVTIPISILTCILTHKIQKFGIKLGILICMCGQLLIYLLLRIFFPINTYIIFFSTFILSIFDNWRFLIGSIFIYEFPLHCYSGMFITFLASSANLGSMLTLHTIILDWVSWWVISWVGLGIQIIIILIIQLYLIDWKNKGIINLNILLKDNNNNNNMECQQQSDNYNNYKNNKFKQEQDRTNRIQLVEQSDMVK